MLLTSTLCCHPGRSRKRMEPPQGGQCQCSSEAGLLSTAHVQPVHSPRRAGPPCRPASQSRLSPHLVVQYNGPGAVKILPHQHLPHGPIQVAHFNPVGSGVCPVHFPANGIHCEPICGLQPCRKSREHTGSCLKTDGIFPLLHSRTGGPWAGSKAHLW